MLVLWPKLATEADVRRAVREEFGANYEQVMLSGVRRFYLLIRSSTVNGRCLEVKPIDLQRDYQEGKRT